MLEQSKKYVDEAQIVVYYNTNEFMPQKRGAKSIEKRSRI